MPDAAFDILQTELSRGGPDAVLARAVEICRHEKKYHELFEALKMQVRRKLGIAVGSPDPGDSLSETQRTELENGLIAACREVGTLLLQAGKVREGWMYLRPVGDKAEAARLLDAVQPSEDNTEELIEVLLHEGIDIGRGFGLVLDSYGTCSSITTYDQAIARRPRKEQEPAAQRLLRRVHCDLVASVKTDIQRQEGAPPKESSLRDLIIDREWLFQENSYHLDTTHLASTTRIARAVSQPDDLRLALDLTEYGRRLSAQFQYAGDEPFTDTYPSHAFFYQALLGENVTEALAYFQQKAELLDPLHHTLIAVETYVDLLARMGRYREALDAAIHLSRPDAQPVGLAPSLIELAAKAGDYTTFLTHCRERGDILGFAAGLVSASAPAKGI